MKRAAVAAILTLLITSGCNDVPPVANYATVFGRVYDAASNLPLAGVVVTVDTVVVATTASDGTYSVVNVPIGPTDVTVTPPSGYAVSDTSSLTFSVRPGDKYRLDLPLKGG